MTEWCPSHLGTEDEVVVALLHDIVAKYGELTIGLSDLPPGATGDTSWPDNMIDLARDLTDDEWVPALARELRKLLAGPYGLTDEDVEKLAIVLRFPDGGERARQLRRAAEEVPDRENIGVVSVDTMPVPVVVPAPRHALADDQLPRSSSWVAGRARRFHRISHH